MLACPKLALATDRAPLLMQGGMESLLALRDNFLIEYSDEVTDGCLPRPARMKDKMELTLRKNGFSIATEELPMANVIVVSAIGYVPSASAICVVHIEANLIFKALVFVPYSQTVPGEDKTLASIVHQFGNVVLTGPKNGMQGRIEKQVEEFGEELYLTISRSKDHIKKHFPEIIEYHEQLNSSAE